jgi:hypothetical protein
MSIGLFANGPICWRGLGGGNVCLDEIAADRDLSGVALRLDAFGVGTMGEGDKSDILVLHHLQPHDPAVGGEMRPQHLVRGARREAPQVARRRGN